MTPFQTVGICTQAPASSASPALPDILEVDFASAYNANLDSGYYTLPNLSDEFQRMNPFFFFYSASEKMSDPR